MKYKRMPIEIESPEMLGYENISYNLAESSVTDLSISEFYNLSQELLLCYGDHIGKKELRALLASLYPGQLNADQFIVTPSAATALFIVHTTLLTKDDHLLVMKPNYATNIETPRAIGCAIDFIDLEFEHGFQTDIEKIKQNIKPNTKLISITTPHNPTGVIFSNQFIQELIRLVQEKNIYLLVDETYKDLIFNDQNNPYYADYSSQVISVSSMSKAYGIPGVRIGWLATKNEVLLETFLAAKEQILICNSVIDEEIAFQALSQRTKYLTSLKIILSENFKYLTQFMDNNPYFEWVVPQGGVVCFPRIKSNITLDLNLFYNTLLNKYSTWVGPGHWFEENKRYFRLGFGYCNGDKFKQALKNLTLSLEEAKK